MNDSIIFAGTPQNAAETLRYLVNAGFEISLVITRPDAPTGRKRTLTSSAVAKVAEEFSLKLIKTSQIGSDEIDAIRDSKAKLAVVVAFGSLLNEKALNSLESGWFNVHYSLLPKWRGAAPVQHSLLDGDSETGVTLFKIDQGVDTGPILSQVPTLINPLETADELLTRLTELSFTLLSQELPKILATSHTMFKQDDVQATRAPKLSRSDARIHWNQSASSIEHQIRAFNSEPGAWTVFGDAEIKIHLAAASSPLGLEVGELTVVENRVFVGCAGGTLNLISVQPASKKPMSATDWARGINTEDRFS